MDGCHLCRSPYPSDVMTVDLMAEGIREDFHGRFDIKIDIKNEEEEIEPKVMLFRIPPINVSVVSHYFAIRVFPKLNLWKVWKIIMRIFQHRNKL